MLLLVLLSMCGGYLRVSAVCEGVCVRRSVNFTFFSGVFAVGC